MSNMHVVQFMNLVEARVGQGYIYGAYFSKVITESYIQQKAQQFPSQYTSSYIQRSRQWIGQYAGDCSGLIKQAWWTRPDGTIEYGYEGRKDRSADGILAAAATKGSIDSMPFEVAGLFVHRSGHIGVYMGGGRVIEARGVDYGVVETALTSELNPRGWTSWGYLPYVEYGNPEPDPEPEPEEENGTDAPGYLPLNTVDEGLEMGPYIRNTDIFSADLGDMDIIIASTVDKAMAPVAGDVYNGVFQGIILLGSHNPAAIQAFIDQCETAGKLDAIITIYQVPHKITQASDDAEVYVVGNAAAATRHEILGPEMPVTVDGYVPKNKKLLTWPYNFVYVHNNNGQGAAFRYEHFTSRPKFELYGPATPNPVYRLVPLNLRAQPLPGRDQDQAITIGGYPTCAWSGEVYKNWLAQNQLNIGTNIAAGAIAAIAGAAVGNVAAIAGGVAAIGHQLQTVYQQSIQPPQAQGQANAAGANNTVEQNDIHIYGKSIRREYAERLDWFFELYGYKTNLVKVPDIKSRPYWNYIKTIDCQIEGAIPMDDMQELKEIFNRGVTIWHDPTALGMQDMLNNHKEVTA